MSFALSETFARRLLLLNLLAISISFADEKSKEVERTREMAAHGSCISKIGQEHQYIMHSWGKDILGLNNFSLFTDYVRTHENKDEQRGVPYHYEQSPEAMHEKISAESNGAEKINYSIEDRHIKIQIVKMQPYKGSRPDPNGTVVTEYYIAADKAQLPMDEVDKAISSGNFASLLKTVGALPGNNGKFPLVVKSKRRFYHGQSRDLDKTVYTQNTVADAFAIAAHHTDEEALKEIYKDELQKIYDKTHEVNKAGFNKLGIERPDVAEEFLKSKLIETRSNLSLLEETSLRMRGCSLNEPGWQEALRKRARDDKQFLRYQLLYVDIIRKILSGKKVEMQGGYISGPIPKTIPWDPDSKLPGGHLKPVANPYDMREQDR